MKLRALLVLFFLCVCGAARAADPRAEAQARDALQKAAADYDSDAFDRAIARLGKASAACGKCSVELRAELLRDAGVMRAKKGDESGAIADFNFALKLVPDIALPSGYDDPKVVAAWKKAKSKGPTPTETTSKAREDVPPPTSDFVHKPWEEQRANTPIPIYTEYPGHLTRVVVAFQSEGEVDWKRIRLHHVGKGWGGAIGCQDVPLGSTVVYFIQGFEGDDLVASAGDKRHPYRTAVRESIEGITPHLPGRPAPHGCDLQKGCDVEPYACGANEPGEHEEGALISRLWIGAAGSVGMAFFGGGDNVCKVNSGGASVTGWNCVTPDGPDFPVNTAENDAVMRTRRVDAGASVAALRVMAAIDYAVTDNLLVGLRVGIVDGVYPGKRGWLPIPLHLEARVAWVFGDQPLARTGFAPTMMLGLGTSRIDANTDVQVQSANVPGTRTLTAWQVGGPFFAGAGGGVRYAFSPRVAFTTLLRLDAAFGGLVVVPAMSLEGGLQWGF